ncbi:MAG: DUF1150 family protein [Alphaproteobacteria bacterium]|nr:DUF1150 family protein [Alphaproteobacteria bacterium]MCB9975318.1 DUF1150 family protein [Rhodospirillales bacterium]
MVNQEQNREDHIRTLLRNMSTEDFMNLGLKQVAYIRPIASESGPLYAVCAADGSPLSVLDTFEKAVLSTLSIKLEPVTLH